jgi:exopolysaccharide production protein ExoZ
MIRRQPKSAATAASEDGRGAEKLPQQGRSSAPKARISLRREAALPQEVKTATTDSGSFQRLRSLDFLRGLAILGVIAVHSTQYFPSGDLVLDGVFGHGARGVQLFYIVSALTMCLMWTLRDGEQNPVKKFYIRRFLRIAPLFWLAVPIHLLVSGLGASYWAPEGIGFQHIFLTMTFLHGFWPSTINSVIPGGWSIAIEMTFYVLFPFLIRLVGRNRRVYILSAAAMWLFNVLLFRDLAMGVFSYHYSTPSDTIIKDFLYLNFISQSPVFFMGCYLYFVLYDSPPTRVELLFIVGWVALAGAMDVWRPSADFGYLVICLSLGVLVFVCVEFHARFLPIELLGRNSYSMYLVHFIVLHCLGKVLPMPAGPLGLLIGMSLAVAISYLISMATYFFIESRVQGFSNRVTQAG